MLRRLFYFASQSCQRHPAKRPATSDLETGALQSPLARSRSAPFNRSGGFPTADHSRKGAMVCNRRLVTMTGRTADCHPAASARQTSHRPRQRQATSVFIIRLHQGAMVEIAIAQVERGLRTRSSHHKTKTIVTTENAKPPPSLDLLQKERRLPPPTTRESRLGATSFYPRFLPHKPPFFFDKWS